MVTPAKVLFFYDLCKFRIEILAEFRIFAFIGLASRVFAIIRLLSILCVCHLKKYVR